MLFPVAATIAVIEDQRLEIIHRTGKFRLRRLEFLELIKKRRQLLFLFLRQNGKDALLRSLLPGFLGFLCLRVIGVGITRINLHNIVDQTHQHNLGNVDRLIGILS